MHFDPGLSIVYRRAPTGATKPKLLPENVLCQARSSDLRSDKEAEVGESSSFVDAG